MSIVTDSILRGALERIAEYMENNATTVSQVQTSGTLIATINGVSIYAPSYTDADGVSY